MRDKIIYCVLTLTLIMEPSIDGLCQFVQNFIITLDSPIFANRYLVGFVVETQVMNTLLVFGYAFEICVRVKKSCKSRFNLSMLRAFLYHFLFCLVIAIIFVSVCLNLFFLLHFFVINSNMFIAVSSQEL